MAKNLSLPTQESLSQQYVFFLPIKGVNKTTVINNLGIRAINYRARSEKHFVNESKRRHHLIHNKSQIKHQ